MSDDPIYDLVRSGLTELAAEARPIDLFPRVERRTRRRRLAMSVAAVCGAAALLLGVPVAVAAAAGGDAGPSTPTGRPSLSFARPAPPPTGPVSWTPSR